MKVGKSKKYRISLSDPLRWEKVSGWPVEIPGFEGIKVFCYNDYVAGGWKFCEETTGGLLHGPGNHFLTKEAGIKALSKAIANFGKEKVSRPARARGLKRARQAGRGAGICRAPRGRVD